MDEWYCTKCYKVFMQAERFAKCCGPLEPFDPCVHGRRLVGLSNSWINVWQRWENHPLVSKAADEVHRGGNDGQARILNVFIEHLLGESEEDGDE